MDAWVDRQVNVELFLSYSSALSSALVTGMAGKTAGPYDRTREMV